MATKKKPADTDVIEGVTEEEPEEFPEDVEEDDLEIDDVEDVDEIALGEEEEEEEGDEDEDEEGEGEGEEALDELEAEELDMLTEDEESEVLIVDEAQEIRSIRREELALDRDPEVPQADEFVCSSCFLVKRTSQLANKRKKICRDCAA